MAPPRKVPTLPSFLGPDDLFRLDGPQAPESRSRLQQLLGAVGSPADWAVIGLPIRFDRMGNPQGRKRGIFYYSYSLVTREEAAGALSCVEVAARLAST